MMKYLIHSVLIILMIAWAGCNKDKDCPLAYADHPNVPADSLCFGRWEWIYTLKHVGHGGPIYVADTIFPDDVELGFETIHYAYGTVGKAEICFNINGSVTSGCYKKWASALYPADVPTYVSAGFLQWSAGHGALVVEAHFPAEPDDPVVAKISTLAMFEEEGLQADTVYYNNWFVKVD